jgi:hypothetical protein
MQFAIHWIERRNESNLHFTKQYVAHIAQTCTRRNESNLHFIEQWEERWRRTIEHKIKQREGRPRCALLGGGAQADKQKPQKIIASVFYPTRSCSRSRQTATSPAPVKSRCSRLPPHCAIRVRANSSPRTRPRRQGMRPTMSVDTCVSERFLAPNFSRILPFG